MFCVAQPAVDGGLVRASSVPSILKPSFQPGTHVVEVDPDTGRILNQFRIIRLLGRGGFAKCYEVSDGKGGNYALKAINRALLTKPKTLQKLHSEIAIHRRMKHENIVRFVHTFKDEHYVYILLEKCKNGTLMDLLKVRPLTVPETQYVMLQSLSAMEYMHRESVIHRDLKPGNIMLDHNLTVKIGDFGLAAELFYDGERKRTVCGTPNYIAPEIIDRRGQGHSFEVDIWSLGVILFTLLVGQPPFQMDDVDATYRRIRDCRYSCPPAISEQARDLIGRILQSSPMSRPTLLHIRTHVFFRSPPPPAAPPASLKFYSLPVPDPQLLRTRSVGPKSSTKRGGIKEREVLHQLDLNKAILGYRDTSQKSSPVPAPTLFNRLPPGTLKDFLRNQGSGTGHRYREDVASPMPPQRDVPIEKKSRAASLANREIYRHHPISPGHAFGLDGVKSHPAGNLAAPTPQARSDPETRPKNELHGELQQLTALHEELHRTLCANAEDNEVEGQQSEGCHATEGAGRSGVLPSPKVWVTECADFSSKYGVCYRLSTGQTGAYFNDSSKMIWDPTVGQVEYYARVRVEIPNGDGENIIYAKDQLEAFNIANYPSTLEKKITLIKYFTSYLRRTNVGANEKVKVMRCSPYAQMNSPQSSEPPITEDFVYVKRWLQTAEALVFRFSNKTVQVCFNDGAEIILSSEWRAVTYTDPSGNRRTLALATVATDCQEAASRLHYTKAILYRLIKEQCI